MPILYFNDYSTRPAVTRLYLGLDAETRTLIFTRNRDEALDLTIVSPATGSTTFQDAATATADVCLYTPDNRVISPTATASFLTLVPAVAVGAGAGVATAAPTNPSWLIVPDPGYSGGCYNLRLATNPRFGIGCLRHPITEGPAPYLVRTSHSVPVRFRQEGVDEGPEVANHSYCAGCDERIPKGGGRFCSGDGRTCVYAEADWGVIKAKN
jgi:hypothetical protein